PEMAEDFPAKAFPHHTERAGDVLWREFGNAAAPGAVADAGGIEPRHKLTDVSHSSIPAQRECARLSRADSFDTRPCIQPARPSALPASPSARIGARFRRRAGDRSKSCGLGLLKPHHRD